MTDDQKEARSRLRFTLLLAAVLLIPVVGLGAAWAVRKVLARRRFGHVCGVHCWMRAYSDAQTMYKRNDWDGDGQLKYAADYTRLNTELDGSGTPIDLIDSAFAAAKGYGGVPKRGYLFKEMSTIGGQSIDWTKDFALCAIPASYGTTGRQTFIVSIDGTVWRQDMGSAYFLDDFPADLAADGWTLVE